MSATLRKTLMDTIDCVAKGDLDPDKARAVAELAKVHIDSQRQALESLKYLNTMAETDLSDFVFQHVSDIIDDRNAKFIDDDDSDSAKGKQLAPKKPKPDTKPLPAIEHKLTPTPASKSKAKEPPRAEWKNAVVAVLQKDQPLDLQEISRRTKIAEQNVYAILKADCFERDTESMYWMA